MLFVFFGATGDLAYKKIFPALQAMIRAGELDMPIVVSRAKDGRSISCANVRATRCSKMAGSMPPLSPS